MENEIKDKWNEIITYMRDTYNINGVLFRTWINPLTIVSCDNDTIILAIDEKEQGDILGLIEKKYKVAFQVSIEVITNHQLDVRFIYQNEMDAKGVSSYNKEEMLEEKYPFLKQGHSFDTFVVSNSNNIAYNAAVAVAENPNGQLYNPLFLYSGPGLGKTHLMHSIARYILENHPEYSVMYTTSENFMNNVVDAIRTNRKTQDTAATSNLRKNYRNVDVLLIDDIQFIIGKDSTQIEFFNTFEALYQSGKQLVISSDKPPSQMEHLDMRYRSRFTSGMTIDIQPPDYETKMAILKKRAELERLDIDPEVMQYVATNINSNIRELEGALNKIFVFANLEKKPVTLELAENALKDTIECQKEVTPQLIMDVVAEHYNISVSDIISKKKNKEIANPRQICMYLSRKYTDYSLQNIGKIMGNRDHTTVIHGHDKINKMLETDETLKSNLDIIIKKLNPPT